jgi:hypothetical protein
LRKTTSLSVFDLMVCNQSTDEDVVEFDVPLEWLRPFQSLIPFIDFESLGHGSHWDNGYTNWSHPTKGEHSAGYYSIPTSSMISYVKLQIES